MWRKIMSTTTDNHRKEQLEQALSEYSTAANTRLARRARFSLRSVKRACVQFGAAGSAALVGGTSVEAAIVYSGPQDIALNVPLVEDSSRTQIDIDGDNQLDFHLYIYNSGGGPVSSTLWATGLSGNVLATIGSSSARRFSFGEQIGTPGSSLGPAGPDGYLGFNGNGFLGVQLSSGNLGWIQVDIASKSLTIKDWAYEDSGRHLAAGATTSIPEPSTATGLALLAIGAAGVCTLRRRKRAAAGDRCSENLS
jgi:hypothetical protein